MYDCIIIGAGPGGLTAAIYLARYRRRILVLSAGRSRADWIPVTHNFPGFPNGVSGETLLARLREQAANYGAEVRQGRVESLQRSATGFTALVDDDRFEATNIILATGVLDQHPDIEGLGDATLAGLVRWCPICDGYDVLDKSVALLAPAQSGLRHALFLRTFTKRLTLLALPDSPGLSPEEVETLEEAGIELITDAAVTFKTSPDLKQIIVRTGAGSELAFDTLYPMSGCTVQSGLATDLGAEADACGDLLVNLNQCSSIPGLYAVGDVVSALNQISVAIGHAAIAATAVHNSLPANPR